MRHVQRPRQTALMGCFLLTLVAKWMQERGTSVRRLPGQLGMTEGALRYRLKKLEGGVRRDGIAAQPTRRCSSKPIPDMTH